MQNKPNVKDAQINVNSYMKSKYEKLDNWLSGKNKPNSNPIKPNLVRRRRIANDFITKDYRKNDVFATQKTNPIQTQFLRKAKMNLKSLAKKSGHTLLWIYLNLFLTPPGQTVRILASDFESALLSLRKEFTWRL